MPLLSENENSRREFLRSGVRYILLGGITVAGALAVRRKAGERCVNSGICRACGQFEGCGLPQALSARQARQGKAWHEG